MAKRTLLEMTQDILSDMDSDEVNSISDTVEATQVATILRNEYRKIIDEHDMAHTEGMFQLTASGTTSRPTHMQLPTNVVQVSWIKYDCRETVGASPSFRSISYLSPNDFIDRVNARNTGDSNVDSITDDVSSVALHIRNDVAPSYWTTFDDEYLIFDSYDSDVDSTLQTSKTICHGLTRTDTTLTDSTIVDLPEHLFSLLFTQAEEFCFDIFKDGTPRTVMQRAHRQRVRSQRVSRRLVTDPMNRLPDYGRK